MCCWFWHRCEVCACSLPEPLVEQVAGRSALNTGDWWEKGRARESRCRGWWSGWRPADSQWWKRKNRQSVHLSTNILPETTGCVSRLTARVSHCLYQFITINVLNVMHTSAIRCPHWHCAAWRWTFFWPVEGSDVRNGSSCFFIPQEKPLYFTVHINHFRICSFHLKMQ